MDSADPQPDGLYIDSLSNLVDFGIKDAMDIHHTEEYFLGTFDELGQGGAHKMHKYTWNKILVPLDLVSTKLESVETFVDMTDQWAIIKWCQEVKPRSVEEIKDDDENIVVCYVTVGTFARRGLSSTAKTLRSLSGVRGSKY